MLFYVSLQSGRTDNVYLEADSKNAVLDLISSLSDCHVSCIKKVVYSKKHLIGTSSGALAPISKSSTKLLRVMCKTQNYTEILEFRFPLKNISKEFVTEQVKKYLTIHNEPIESVINIIRF